MKGKLALFLCILLAFAPLALAKGGGGSSSGKHLYSAPKSSGSHKSSAGATKHRSSKCTPCKRDRHGDIERSSAARDQFMNETGYPKGRPGYVVDHIVPLKEGGCDCPANMQWQTIAAAKAKDKIE